MKDKIYEVIWIDSAADSRNWVNQHDIEDIAIAPECKSVGYLILEDKEKVVICTSINDFQYGRIFTIPKCCIKKKKLIS